MAWMMFGRGGRQWEFIQLRIVQWPSSRNLRGSITRPLACSHHRQLQPGPQDLLFRPSQTPPYFTALPAIRVTQSSNTAAPLRPWRILPTTSGPRPSPTGSRTTLTLILTLIKKTVMLREIKEGRVLLRARRCESSVNSPNLIFPPGTKVISLPRRRLG